MKKSMPPEVKPGAKDGKKAPPKAKRDEREAMPAEGDAAPKRGDRPGRKSGGAVKKGGH